MDFLQTCRETSQTVESKFFYFSDANTRAGKQHDWDHVTYPSQGNVTIAGGGGPPPSHVGSLPCAPSLAGGLPCQLRSDFTIVQGCVLSPALEWLLEQQLDCHAGTVTLLGAAAATAYAFAVCP